MARTINEVGADIVGLQEMRGRGESIEYDDQTARLSERTALKYRYFGKAIYFENLGPYGNSVISKNPIVSAKVIPIPDPDPKTGSKYYETRALLKLRYQGGITVMTTHFGLNEDEQRNAVQTIVENLEPERCVLMGDFNLTPDSEILKPIKEKMVDTADFCSSECLTFPSDKPYEKIDYIFVTPDIKVLSAEAVNIVASDHRPFVAELDLEIK